MRRVKTFILTSGLLSISSKRKKKNDKREIKYILLKQLKTVPRYQMIRKSLGR